MSLQAELREDPEAGPLLDQPDMSKQDALKKFKVTEYKGFYEQTYRLVFNFEDYFDDTAPQHLMTVLPHGKIENDKQLKAEKTKGLLCWPFVQSIEEEVLNEAIRTKEFTEDMRDCPFIWKRTDGSNVLVQTWTTNFNEQFTKTFQVFKDNPTTTRFIPQAVDEFQASMTKLFGEKARNHGQAKVQYAISGQQNEKSVFFGTGKDLVAFFRASSEVRTELNLASVLDSGFVANLVNGKGETGTKDFKMDPLKQSAVYTKKGWEVMACSKPTEQFITEAVVKEEIEGVIPKVLLATPLPNWAYDADVTKLFFNDKSKVIGVPEIPRPIPIDACVGPAVRWAAYRAGVLWMQVFLTTIGAYVFFIRGASECVLGKTHYHTFSGSHATLHQVQPVIWLTFLCSAAFGLYAEFKMVRFFVVPWIQQVHGCMMPIIGHRPFHTWFFVMMCSSFISMLSIQSNAIFMLTTLEFEKCHHRQTKLWSYMMKESRFGTELDWTYISPGFLVFLFWCISTLQLWWPLFTVTPLPCRGHDESVMYDINNFPVRWKTPSNYFSALYDHDECTHYEALMGLAHSTGVATIGAGVFSYPFGKMGDEIKQRNEGWERRAMVHLQSAQRAAFRRLLLDAFLKKSLQLKVQVSLYAIHRAMIEDKYLDAEQGFFTDCIWLSLLPICVTLLSGFAFQLDLFVMCIRRQLEVNNAVDLRWHLLKDDDKSLYRKLNRGSFCIFLIFAVCAILIGYSCVQIVKLHGCKTSLWNMDGCVTVHEILELTNKTDL